MRLMRVEAKYGPLRINPQMVGGLSRDSLTQTRLILAFPALDTDTETGISVDGTLDALAAEWAAAMQEDEPRPTRDAPPPVFYDTEHPSARWRDWKR